MKWFFSLGLIATVLAAFAFTSCSKDDDDDSIVGKWEYTSTKIEGNEYSKTYDREEGESEIFEFKSDGTCVNTTEYDGDIDVVTGKYTTSGNTLSIIDDEDGDEYKIKFSVSGNTLTLYEEGYYDLKEGEFCETQPAGENYVKVKMSMIYKRK